MNERKKESLHIRVKRSWLKNLKSISVRSGISQASIVEVAVLEYIENHWKELKDADNGIN